MPATSISPSQIIVSQKKQCKGRRAWLISFPWPINTGGKGDEEYLPVLTRIPVGEKLIDECHFLLSIAGKTLLSSWSSLRYLNIYIPSVLIYIGTSELSGVKGHSGTILYW